MASSTRRTYRTLVSSHLSQAVIPSIIDAWLLSLLNSIELPLRSPLSLRAGCGIRIGEALACPSFLCQVWRGSRLRHDSCVQGDAEGEDPTVAEKARQFDIF